MKYDNLSKYKEFFKNYTELRVQENVNLGISMLNGNIVGNSKSANSGVSARSFKSGSWGFASNPTISDESVKAVIEAANNNAEFLVKKMGQKNIVLPNKAFTGNFDYSSKKNEFSQKEIIEFMQEIDCYIVEKYKDLHSRTVALQYLGMEKTLVTENGSDGYSFTPRTIMYVVLSKINNGQPFELGKAFGGLGQIQDILVNPEALYAEIDELYNHLVAKSEAIYAEAGMKDVVLDADLAGILAHEAIGHTVEADGVLGGSVAAEYMNEKVASDLVTLVDYAYSAFGETCPVPVHIDDEGVEGKDSVIIENGVLKAYLHNKESANHFNVEPMGNARAYGDYDEPLIRMRNTAINPGTSKLEDMIASIEDGYYLIKPSNGQADSTSEFMFGITLGYEIKNGKIGKAIRDTTISGIAFDVLKSITMISDDLKWGCAGMCGKKQWIPVGMGGPAIKCKINLGGK